MTDRPDRRSVVLVDHRPSVDVEEHGIGEERTDAQSFGYWGLRPEPIDVCSRGPEEQPAADIYATLRVISRLAPPALQIAAVIRGAEAAVGDPGHAPARMSCWN
jgi:hypothetical protein